MRVYAQLSPFEAWQGGKQVACTLVCADNGTPILIAFELEGRVVVRMAGEHGFEATLEAMGVKPPTVVAG